MKKLFFAVLHGTGVTRLVGWLHRRQTVFLCYHSVPRLRETIPHELKLHRPLRNFLPVVAPLLVERGLSAAAFIITKCASEREGFRPGEEWALADDYMRLSWAEVRALAATPGIEIGSHSHTHRDLTTAAPEEVEQELRESYEAVVEHTGRPRPALASQHGRAHVR